MLCPLISGSATVFKQKKELELYKEAGIKLQTTKQIGKYEATQFPGQVKYFSGIYTCKPSHILFTHLWGSPSDFTQTFSTSPLRSSTDIPSSGMPFQFHQANTLLPLLASCGHWYVHLLRHTTTMFELFSWVSGYTGDYEFQKNGVT